MRQVEEALARQVIYGGDLVTNLLEVARVDEVVLTGLLAESMRLAPAPAGELPRAAGAGAVPRAPRDRGAADGRSAGGPGGRQAGPGGGRAAPGRLAEQLRFALGMSLEQRAAPAVRVHQAVARAYGVPLDRRMLRLIARLGGDTPESGRCRRRSASRPRPRASASAERAPAIRQRRGPPAAVVGRLAPKVPGIASRTQASPRRRRGGSRASRRRSGRRSRALPAALDDRRRSPARTPSWRPGRPPPRRRPAPPPASRPPASRRLQPAPPQVAPAAPGEVRAGLLQRAASMAPRPLRRRRGPITVERPRGRPTKPPIATRCSICSSTSRGSSSTTRRSFSSTATSPRGATRSAAAPRASGCSASASRSTCRACCRRVREKRLPVVAKAPADGLDAVLLADLHRARDSEMAIVPLVVRTRAVAILIGDCGDAGVDRESVQQVMSFSGVVGKAFERIIVRRKLDGFIAGGRDSASGRVSPSMVGTEARAHEAAGSVPSTARPRAASHRARRRVELEAAPCRVPARARVPRLRAPVPFVPKRAAASAGAREPRPPGTAAAAPRTSPSVRQISGPPIPREEPDTPGVCTPSSARRRRRPRSLRLHRSPAPSRSSPQLEIVELEVATTSSGARCSLRRARVGGSEVRRVRSRRRPRRSPSPPHRPPAPVDARAGAAVRHGRQISIARPRGDGRPPGLRRGRRARRGRAPAPGRAGDARHHVAVPGAGDLLARPHRDDAQSAARQRVRADPAARRARAPGRAALRARPPRRRRTPRCAAGRRTCSASCRTSRPSRASCLACATPTRARAHRPGTRSPPSRRPRREAVRDACSRARARRRARPIASLRSRAMARLRDGAVRPGAGARARRRRRRAWSPRRTTRSCR